MYVAVVISREALVRQVKQRGAVARSGRDEGSWAAFVGEDEDAVIGLALESSLRWAASPRGSYRVLVGKLTSEAGIQYRVVDLVEAEDEGL